MRPVLGGGGRGGQDPPSLIIPSVNMYNHITYVLWELHWLLLSFHAQLRVLVLSFKALKGPGLGYLQQHSAHPLLLTVTCTRTALLGVLSAKEARQMSTQCRAF